MGLKAHAPSVRPRKGLEKQLRSVGSDWEVLDRFVGLSFFGFKRKARG